MHRVQINWPFVNHALYDCKIVATFLFPCVLQRVFISPQASLRPNTSFQSKYVKICFMPCTKMTAQKVTQKKKIHHAITFDALVLGKECPPDVGVS